MRAFLINLDRNKARFEQACAQLDSLHIAYERFPAVDGKALSYQARNRHVARFRARLARLNKLTPGEVGCTLSHLFIYKKMVEERIPIALIFEDDILLSRQFPRALAKVSLSADVSKPQVFLFTWSQSQSIDVHDNCEFKIARVPSALRADAYVITLPAAKAIFNINYPVVTMNDWWGRWRRRNLIDLFRVVPTTSTQRQGEFTSDVTPHKSRALSGIRWVVWKMIRVPCVMLDWMLWILLRK